MRPAGLAVTAAALAVALLAILSPPLSGTRARAGGETPPRVALTFDDGYNFDHRIVDFLSSQGIRATAFVIGSWAQRNPSLLQELSALGWDVCNHTQNHPWLTRLPDAQVVAELNTCQAVIGSLTGQYLPVFRPPGGFIDARVTAVAAAAGYSPVMWSIDSGDARGVDFSVPERVAYMVNASKEGSVILFHFGGRHTYELVTGLVNGLRERGFCFVTISELYGWKNVVRGGDSGPGTAKPSTFLCFPEGTTRPGFEEWILVFNPGEEEARVRATFVSPRGNAEREYEVPPGARRSLCVNTEFGLQDDVSILLESSQPVVAERMLYSSRGGGLSGGTLSTGLSEPSLLRCFAEGTTREGFQEYLAVFNPSSSEAELELEIGGAGSDRKTTVRLPPRQRTTLHVNDMADSGDHSLILRSSTPVFAERSSYFAYQGRITGAAGSTGASRPSQEWYFAEGTTREFFQSYLILYNPCRQDTWVKLDLFTEEGPAGCESMVVRSGERKTVRLDPLLPKGVDFSMRVRSLLPLVAERPTYFQSLNTTGGYCSAGTAAPQREWLFAEGCTTGEFREWLAMFNPFQAEQDVEVTILADGREEKRRYSLPPLARVTVDVGGEVGGAVEVSMEVRAPLGVVAERSLYFTRW